MAAPSATMLLAVMRAARPTFRSAHDKVAFAVHSALLSQGFKLVAVGNQPELKTEAALSAKEVSAEGWNDGEDCYSFQYARKGGEPRVLTLKALTVEELLVVSLGEGGGEREPQVGELRVERYTKDAGNSEDLEDTFHNLEELAEKVTALVPAAAAVAGTKGATATAPRPAPPSTTTQPAPSRPLPPDSPPTRSPLLDDRQPQPFPHPLPSPYDIDPLAIPGPGGLPPFGGRLPGVGGIPGGLPGGGFQGGGMHVGPGHEIFQGRVRHPGRMGGGIGGPPGVPHGVRWDPVRPEGLEGWSPEDFQRGGQRPSFHPDLAFPPPGGGPDWDNMYG